MDAAKVGTTIANRRRGLGMTQQELAELIHVTNKAVSKWENGRNFPDLALIEPIAVAGIGGYLVSIRNILKMWK